MTAPDSSALCKCGHPLSQHSEHDDAPCEGDHFRPPGSFVPCECPGFAPVAAPVLSLARLRERAEKGNADLADETSSVISRDDFLALIEIAEDALALLDQHISDEQRRELGRRIIGRLS